MTERNLDPIARAIASGCYDELVDKSDISREEYIDKYAHLFWQAAAKAVAAVEAQDA